MLVTAADARYGYWLLNLLGSIAANSRTTFDSTVVYDLGLTPFQRRLLDGVRGIDVRTVPPFVPHWREGFTWKPWIWTHVDADAVFWLDAGTTVLRSLAPVREQIETDGYFLVSQGRPVKDLIPSDYYELYGLAPASADERLCVAAGITGFRRDGAFYELVVQPTYRDCLAGHNLGFSRDEAMMQNFGLNRTARPIIRDCPLFRHDQSILNIHLVRELPDACVNDLDRFGGWRSRADHPEQVIWSHRRRGDYAYIAQVRYRGSTAPLGVAFGVAFRLRWWYATHRWIFRASTYVARLRRRGIGVT